MSPVSPDNHPVIISLVPRSLVPIKPYLIGIDILSNWQNPHTESRIMMVDIKDFRASLPRFKSCV